jgi:hypothetical protein
MNGQALQTLDLETEDITSRNWEELVSEFLGDDSEIEPDHPTNTISGTVHGSISCNNSSPNCVLHTVQTLFGRSAKAR